MAIDLRSLSEPSQIFGDLNANAKDTAPLPICNRHILPLMAISKRFMLVIVCGLLLRFEIRIPKDTFLGYLLLKKSSDVAVWLG